MPIYIVSFHIAIMFIKFPHMNEQAVDNIKAFHVPKAERLLLNNLEVTTARTFQGHIYTGIP
jgi:hypothetical protein